MAALSPATAGFGACVVPSSRAECQCRVSVAERRCPHSASCQAEGTLASGGGEGSAEGERLAERGTRPGGTRHSPSPGLLESRSFFQNKSFYKVHVYLLSVGSEGLYIAVLRAAS